MKPKSSAFCAVAFALVSCHASAQTLSDDLAARYRGFERAIQHKDQKFLDAYLAPNYSVDLPNGQTADKTSTLKAFNDLAGIVSNIHWTFKLSNPSVSSAGAVVEVRGDMSGTVIGPDKKKHKVRILGLTEDTWIVQDNHWVQSHVKVLDLSATLDGKPAPLPGAP